MSRQRPASTATQDTDAAMDATVQMGRGMAMAGEDADPEAVLEALQEE